MGNTIELLELNVESMLSDEKERYIIPQYQRPFSWNKEHWGELLQDIEQLSDSEEHFLGPIVLIPDDAHKKGVNTYQVVDGQQRLATITTLLCALRDLNAEKAGPKDFEEQIERLLWAKKRDMEKSIVFPKLQLAKKDNDALGLILSNKKGRDEKHPLENCYRYYISNLRKKDPAGLYEVFKRVTSNLYVIHINAKTSLSAFRLFETLNDRGLELSAIDMLKNFLLQKIASISPGNETAMDLLVDEWNSMFEKVRHYEPVKFIWRYSLCEVFSTKVSETKLYEELKRAIENNKEFAGEKGLLDFVAQLSVYSEAYRQLCASDFVEDSLAKKMRHLNLIKVVASYTLLMKLVELFNAGVIKRDAMLRIMSIIENFHIRWGVCDMDTSKLDAFYTGICVELRKPENSGTEENVLKTINGKFQPYFDQVSDKRFCESFAANSFAPSDKRTKYILWRLSNPSGETDPDWKKVETEHVMPQEIANWEAYLSTRLPEKETDLKRVHKKHIDLIGNLAIILGKFNKELSNKSFEEKKKMERYEKSDFALTRAVCEKTDWDFATIVARSEEFAQLAVKVWPFPNL